SSASRAPSPPPRAGVRPHDSGTGTPALHQDRRPRPSPRSQPQRNSRPRRRPGTGVVPLRARLVPLRRVRAGHDHDVHLRAPLHARGGGPVSAAVEPYLRTLIARCPDAPVIDDLTGDDLGTPAGTASIARA